MQEFTEGTLAVVFYGEKFVELSEGGITLEDVCDAFGVTYGEGVFVSDKATKQPIATLPYEAVFTPAPTTTSNEEIDDGDDGPAILELICPSSGSADLAKAQDAADGVGMKRESAGEDGVTVDVDAEVITAMEGAGSGAASSMAVAMRELVRLGAVELLSADSAQRIAQMPAYSVKDAPGLLRRTVYPAAQYSPFRARRDPLYGPSPSSSSSSAAAAVGSRGETHPHGMERHSPNTRMHGFTTFQKDGAPYVSALDTYGANIANEEDTCAIAGVEMPDAASGSVVGEAEERVSALLRRQRPDLVPLSSEEFNKIFSS